MTDAAITRGTLGKSMVVLPSEASKPAVFGMLLFLATEAMFFAGLISAYTVLRAGAAAWPPPGQPALPVVITGINTLLLLASAATMRGARQALVTGSRRLLTRWLATTAALGVVFLVVQGTEWVRLLQHGLTVSANVYGALFYLLIGAHGVHVVGGLAALCFVLVRVSRGRYIADRPTGIVLCSLYWWFVVGVWPVLYVLVYLL